jgi:hypothetical protein
MFQEFDMSYVAEKNKNEILEAMAGTAQPGSAIHEQQKSAILVRCTEDIEDAFQELGSQLTESVIATEKMSNRIYWLNVVLAIASLTGAIATVVIAYKTV